MLAERGAGPERPAWPESTGTLTGGRPVTAVFVRLCEEEKGDMENETTKCVECGGEMSEGFILNMGFRAAAGASTWQEGDSEPSFWSGIKPSGKAKHPTTVYRYAVCGYLEAYAK